MPSQRLLVVDDDVGMRQALCDTLSAEGFETLVADDGAAALAVLDTHPVDLVLTDIQMPNVDGMHLMRAVRERAPEQPIIMMTAYGTIDEAVTSMLDGASNYLVKPFAFRTLLDEIDRLLPAATDASTPVAVDPKTLDVLTLARRVAARDATVTLTGESGTGKEVIARYIHVNSAQREREMVSLNCAAIPENMLEAVLFGHTRGAFTGANADTPGKFEVANDSTLLLDEISEMSLPLQAKLLRVLQEREVERLGSHKKIALNVRVIATSNRDLNAEVAAGRFREDLYYRLNVFPIHIPALRERPADILPLATALLSRHASGPRVPTITTAARAALRAYSWPGNVRELDNVMQRALVLCGDASLDQEHLRLSTRVTESCEASSEDNLQAAVANSEAQAIAAALAKHGGVKKAAAAELGISPRTLRYKLSRLKRDGIWSRVAPMENLR
ncbi:MAG: sigma-54 dependent transcriptional regulator [Pseudomonadota bacterium]